ncbi:hypothetical protein CY35_14G105100 [Sphagnum magellanicum]|nr:hypothetical protein CY35_14G105100 [Sphagnum magellanicum]
MVRGKVQSKASVESKDKNHDRGALTAQNVNKNAVYLERSQMCLYNEWRGLFGWSYEWRAILGWGSCKEQVMVLRCKVFIFSKLLNLQNQVDCEPITRMYYFAVI